MEVAMAENYFRVGDRVQVGASTVFTVGRTGGIVRSFVGEDDLYDVQFDGDRAPHLMLISELELLPRPSNQSAPATSGQNSDYRTREQRV
jgi:hypothetical protein